ELEGALDSTAKVACPHDSARRVADPVAQPERVRPARIGWLRQCDRQVGHDLGALTTSDPLEGGEAVVRQAQQRTETDGRVEGCIRVEESREVEVAVKGQRPPAVRSRG